MVSQVMEQGATPLLVGSQSEPQFERGTWFFPTPLSVPSNDVAIMKEETFGLVVATLSISDFDQALAYSNATDYGPSAFVFTRDNRRIMRCVQDLEFGEIYVNRAQARVHTGFTPTSR